MISPKEGSLITEVSPNPFIEAIADLLTSGSTLTDIEAVTPDGFTRDDLVDIREHIADRLSPEERLWVDQQLAPPTILEQIQDAATTASAKRAEFESADAELLALCASAVAAGRSYTDIAAAAGMSRQVLTKRLERRRLREHDVLHAD